MAAKPAPKSKPAPTPKAAPAPKAEKPPKAAPAPKPPKDESNGITRPKADSKTGRVWAIADEITKSQKGTAATRAQVMEKAVAEDINEATIATQYQRWRVYNGVERVRAEKPAKPAKEPKAK